MPLTEFNKRRAAKDGLQSRCRSCSRQWYLANRETHALTTRTRTRRVRAELAARLIDYLMSHPCVDCGLDDLRCLEFDHRKRSEKRYNVTKMADLQKPWEEILLEIEKCDVRCSNCHRIRTAAQFDTRRHRVMENEVLPEIRAVALGRLDRLFGSGRATTLRSDDDVRVDDGADAGRA